LYYVKGILKHRGLIPALVRDNGIVYDETQLKAIVYIRKPHLHRVLEICKADPSIYCLTLDQEHLFVIENDQWKRIKRKGYVKELHG